MKKTITRRSLLAALASFSFFIPTTALSAKGRELAIFYSFSGNSKRVAEVFQMDFFEINVEKISNFR